MPKAPYSKRLSRLDALPTARSHLPGDCWHLLARLAILQSVQSFAAAKAGTWHQRLQQQRRSNRRPLRSPSQSAFQHRDQLWSQSCTVNVPVRALLIFACRSLQAHAVLIHSQAAAVADHSIKHKFKPHDSGQQAHVGRPIELLAMACMRHNLYSSTSKRACMSLYSTPHSMCPPEPGPAWI